MFRNLSRKITNSFMNKKKFSTSESGPTSYAQGIKVWHMIQAVGITGITISGYIASRIDPKTATEEQKVKKKNLMTLHKSFGLLMLGAIIPRVFYRLTTAIPAHLPATTFEMIAAKANHYGLYALMILMPVTGAGMGYFSGGGIPFFYWKVPGTSKANAGKEYYKKLTGFCYRNHKRMGSILEYLIPLHVGAVAFVHLVKGQNAIRRINPFIKKGP
jgi:cytochrome b561